MTQVRRRQRLAARHAATRPIRPLPCPTALYVATAEVRGARLCTADERLVRTLAGSEWEDRVRAGV